MGCRFGCCSQLACSAVEELSCQVRAETCSPAALSFILPQQVEADPRPVGPSPWCRRLRETRTGVPGPGGASQALALAGWVNISQSGVAFISR